jgi:hypothetical protein
MRTLVVIAATTRTAKHMTDVEGWMLIGGVVGANLLALFIMGLWIKWVRRP